MDIILWLGDYKEILLPMATIPLILGFEELEFIGSLIRVHCKTSPTPQDPHPFCLHKLAGLRVSRAFLYFLWFIDEPSFVFKSATSTSTATCNDSCIETLQRRAKQRQHPVMPLLLMLENGSIEV